MVREYIVNEVSRILLGPMNGMGEKLTKNPLDFYSVGVLFPQQSITQDYAEQDDQSVGKGVETNNINLDDILVSFQSSNEKKRTSFESKEPGSNSELELTTKFLPSAAGISVLVNKNSSIEIIVKFGTYSKIKDEQLVDSSNQTVSKSSFIYKHLPHSYFIKISKDSVECGNLLINQSSNCININLDDFATLNITTRLYANKQSNQSREIKTITIINHKINKGGKQKKSEDCIFHPEIRITNEDTFCYFEDQTDLNLLSQEDLNLKLLFKNYNIYAQGHGISVNWHLENRKVNCVYTEVLPKEKVNGVELNPKIFWDCDILYIKRLSGKTIYTEYNWENIKSELLSFANLYEEWINGQFLQIEDLFLDPLLKEKAKNNLDKCKILYTRMVKGVEILTLNLEARKAFEDANKAMFMQRVMADFSKHRMASERVKQNDSSTDDSLPEFINIPFNASSNSLWKNGKLTFDSLNYDKKGNLARWRPFQLAFLLSQIEGIIDPKSEDRDTVDLIWFPTGGGKTEAYLGLTAFTIFFRRLSAKKIFNSPDKGAGVTVLMRYTLRLLNKQQFERATILICACDLIRRKEPNHYGKIRISNGIWMGRSMTPNSEDDQQKDYADYIKKINSCKPPNTYKSSPPLLSCPCCGNRLVREISNKISVGRWGYFRLKNNRGIETGRYLIACTNTHCEFHTSTLNYQNENTIPVFEVDETIYHERPSLLFSTVDKFVQLAWKTEAFNLFNIEFQNNQILRLFPSPELIIQDELHLISSALGTIYGVYETVLDKLCNENNGCSPKIVGATATVRNAEEQCKRLYGKKKFLQFPPAAIDADDSFYAKKITEEDPKNRLYVGFMPSGVTTSTALIRLTSVLLERIPTITVSNEELDKYYTLVVYFNALKELGKFRTFITDDIVAYRKMLANNFNTFVKQFNYSGLCELSSVMTSDEITKGLDKLEKTTLPKNLDTNNILVKKLYESGIRTVLDFKTAKGANVWKSFLNKDLFSSINLEFSGNSNTDYITFFNAVLELFKDQPDPIQIAPATNMISVGVDIPRLNTMIINGQPKTAAEYIQASSRVGREDKGVVFSFLSPTKNRDRSHYEQFKAFHQAYYYHVESSSVTPYSRSALEKVLPTVLVALTRSLYLKGAQGSFSSDEIEYKEFITNILNDIKIKSSKIYPQFEAKQIAESIDIIQQDFESRLLGLNGDRRLAKYSDFMSYDSITDQIITQIKNPKGIYNAPSHFVDSLLKDHIPTMQTLRNVETSSKVRIKSI